MIGTILWAVIGGAIIGILGRLLLPGKQNISVWLTVGVGILAALLGGLLADWLGVGDTRGVDWLRHVIQVLLAMLFVWLAARYMGSSARRRTPHRPATPR